MNNEFQNNQPMQQPINSYNQNNYVPPTPPKANKPNFIVIGIIAIIAVGGLLLIANTLLGFNNNNNNSMFSGKKQAFEDGAVVYYNPETGKKCNDYKRKNSINENKKGCLKWYVFLCDGSDNVNLLLDHNTTAMTMYLKKGWNRLVVEDDLNELKSLWNKDVRLITVEEIKQITNNSFEITNSNHTFATTNRIGKGQSKYAWLFDNLYECEEFGCNEEDNKRYPAERVGMKEWMVTSYWTGSLANEGNPDYRYVVHRFGGIAVEKWAGNGTGTRPVVTISKSLIN